MLFELNVPSETITLTEDVTAGCNIAMWGIERRRSYVAIRLRTPRHRRNGTGNQAQICVEVSTALNGNLE